LFGRRSAVARFPVWAGFTLGVGLPGELPRFPFDSVRPSSANLVQGESVATAAFLAPAARELGPLLVIPARRPAPLSQRLLGGVAPVAATSLIKRARGSVLVVQE
jgi:hypothetical protein